MGGRALLERYSWMHIALLPFIDEKRLLASIRPLESTLNAEETRRNSLLSTVMVIHKSHPLSWSLLELEAKKEKKACAIQAEKNNCISGTAVIPDGAVGLCPKVIRSCWDVFPDVQRNSALGFSYQFPAEQVHIPRPLKGTEMPPKVLRNGDTPMAPEIWHETTRGGHGGGRGGRSGRGGYGVGGRGRGWQGHNQGGSGHFAQQQILQHNAHEMIYGRGGGRGRGLHGWFISQYLLSNTNFNFVYLGLVAIKPY